jgi:hypothetical protein
MPETIRKRGLLLRVCLFAMMWVSAGWIYGYFSWNRLVERHQHQGSSYPHPPSWVLGTLGVIAITNFVLLVLIYKWKKWPFFALVGVSVLMAIIHGVGFGNITWPIFWFLEILCLYLAMRPKWSLFE